MMTDPATVAFTPSANCLNSAADLIPMDHGPDLFAVISCSNWYRGCKQLHCADLCNIIEFQRCAPVL